MSEVVWTGFLTVLKILYAACVIILSIYGFNSLFLALLYLLSKKRGIRNRTRLSEDQDWPKVTIQLPLYNESIIIERLLNAVTHQVYPRDRFQIQVLDDSTDETTEIARSLVERYRSQGFDITLLHRNVRLGYKAGALQEGLKSASGEFLAIFDADFVPPPSWLKTVIAEFDDPRIGCLQTRWGHLNSRYNLLTKAQTLGLDAHFVVEQGARFASNLFMGFNGSGGIWRRECIKAAGGWSWDTLTEDLDLSYRAQLKGWRIKYLPEIVVPGELPAQIDAFKAQQSRWAKGSVQTLRKLGREILFSKHPLYIRLAGLMHLSMYMPFFIMLLILLLTLPVALWASSSLKLFPWTILASIGPPLLYSIGRTSHLPHLRDRLVRLPLLTILGIGISLNIGLAVLSGLYRKGGVFHRTPKFAIQGRGGSWKESKYALPRSGVVWGELVLAGYAIYSTVILLPTPEGRAIVPGLLLYAIGFLFVSGMSFVQSWQQQRMRKLAARSGKQSAPVS